MTIMQWSFSEPNSSSANKAIPCTSWNSEVRNHLLEFAICRYPQPVQLNVS